MGVAGGFLLCGAVIELLIVFFTVGFAVASGSTLPRSSAPAAQMYTAAALGVGLVTQLSSLLIPVACKALVRKSSIILPDEFGIAPRACGKDSGFEAPAVQFQPHEQDKTEVAAEFVDLPDFDRKAHTETQESAAPAGRDQYRHGGSEAADSREENRTGLDSPQPSTGDYYDVVPKLIENASTGTLLMGAQKASELPVTAAVNLAVGLARKGRQCLLVDTDCQRNTIAKVFDVESGGSLKPCADNSAIPTCIKGLCVWPASAFEGGSSLVSGQELRQVVASAVSRYNHVIIYAPIMGMVSDLAELADCIDAAVLFGQENDSMHFEQVLLSRGCTVRRRPDIRAEAV